MISKSVQSSVPDMQQRQRAISPEGSFIVQAPAGSGKTELLIQRYLKLLSLVDHPEEIVAITFTRKAAAEMQGRILDALERVRNQIPSRNDATQLTDEIAADVLRQDRKHNWQLQDNPGRLRIQTIDSLCAWLTRQMPILSGFGAQPETVDDAADLYLEAAANTLSELEGNGKWSDDIAVLLTHLDNDIPKAKNMLATMLASRDQWLRHVAKKISREELEEALKHVVESALNATRQAFPEEHVHEFLECLRFATDNLTDEKSASLLRYCTGIDHLPGVTAIELPRWQAIAEFCLTQKNIWRKRVDRNLGFPATDTGRSMKDRFQALLAHLSRHDDLLNQLQELRQLPPYKYSDNEWQVVNALCQLLILADAQLQVLFADRNQIDFTGISRAAIQALGDDESPANLALQLDYRIKHLLIDEFQDVSTTQYKLVEKLTAGWSEGDGHTLFLVGDPMQSIYRFREAEVGLFVTTWQEQRLAQVPLEPLKITVNFRSQAGIVNWVNDSFKMILPEKSDSTRGAVSYEEATAFHSGLPGDAVKVHPFLEQNYAAEATRIVSIVSEVIQEGNVAILVRNRSHLLEIIPALKQAGLRFRAVEIEELKHRPEIQDLLALTMAINHFADRIAWLSVLRAPWCGLTLNDLFNLAGGQKDKTVWECMQDEDRLASLSTDGQQRLLKLRAVIQLSFAEHRSRSLRRTVESVWMSLGGPATLQDDTALENVQVYFELLERHEDGGELRYRDKFCGNVEKLFASPDVHAGDNLQIMTIHKAKGLEFDTVIIPGLHRTGRRDGSQLLLWSETPYHIHQDLLLAPIKEAGQQKSPVYDYVKYLDKRKQDYETGRMLYVATTRARKKLHLLGAVKINAQGNLTNPRSGSLLAQMWNVVSQSFEKELEHVQLEIVSKSEDTVPVVNQVRRLISDWVLVPPPDPVTRLSLIYQGELPIPEYEWAGETIRHIGTVVHHFIQIMAEEGINTWSNETVRARRPRFEHSLKQLGVNNDTLAWAADSVESALNRFINDERGRWLFSDSHAEQQNEYALSGVYEGRIVNVRIDRTFVDKEGVRWVIDYKTSRHEGPDLDAFLDQEVERYRPQLEKYAAIMQSLDDRPVKLGLYFPLLQGWREIH